MYKRIDGIDDVIGLLVKKYGSDTINQLDTEVNGYMSPEAFTHLKWYLTKELLPIWDQIYIPKQEQSSKIKSKTVEPEKQEMRKIPIKKYSGNGRLPLHESIVLGLNPKFVSLDNEGKPVFKDSIEEALLVPADGIDTHNPLPYVFASEEEFNDILKIAKDETLDSLFSKVEIVFKRYFDVEDYYYPILVGDIIWSYFQDRFGYTHYDVFVGDNGSGKNSALLAFKYLGYRVFYVVSASAANYYTELGDKEEGQITIAEDEAEDIAYVRDKKNVVNTGYCSGGSVPKVELEGEGKRRRTESWLTYCHKWYAMEEIPDEKRMKATLDRSFVFHFIPGNVPYNIKDVMAGAGDPKFGLY